MTHQNEPATLSPRAAQALWLRRIRELRTAGYSLDDARGIAGPMPRTPAEPAEMDALATAITYGVLLAAFAEHGITPRAFCAAWHAVLHSDAFEESDARARPVRDS